MKLLLLLLLSQQQPALTPRVVPCVRGALLQADGGVADVGKGTWFCELEVLEMGQDHAYLRKTNEELQKSSMPYLAEATGMGVALGVVIGIAIGAAGRGALGK